MMITDIIMTFINDNNVCRSAVSGLSFGDLPELSRAEEKEAMKTNNNKLANYIDNVRRLQKENAKMIRQIEVIESSQAKEIQDLRGIYDREIGDLKAAIKTMQVSSLPRSAAYSLILNTGFEGAFIK